MKLNVLNIIKLLQVKGIGRGKVFKLDSLFPYNPKSDGDLADLLLEKSNDIRVPNLVLSDVLKAFERGEDIYEKSLAKGIKIIPFDDSHFPTLLKNIASPPILLNVLGNIDNLLDKPGVAVIGTRQPSTFGRQIGERIGYRLGENNINVISGLAIGCDTAGHIGCLKAKGTTTAILAHGLDSVYPKENSNLAKEIVENGGCLISEYLIKTGALANYFVERDRIQAGLSQATFVVETDVRGGTMHAVNATIENKRILAVYNHPPDKQTDKSRGNQMLIQQKKAIGIQTKEEIEDFIKRIIPEKKTLADHEPDLLNSEKNIHEMEVVSADLIHRVNGNDHQIDTIIEVKHHGDFSGEPFTLTPPPPKRARKKASTNGQTKRKSKPKVEK